MRVLKVLAVIFMTAFLFTAGSMVFLLSAKDSASTEKQEITIVKGNSRSQIADQLSQAGMIRSSFAMFVYMKLTKVNAIPGTYELSKSMSGSAMAEKLAKGEFKTVKATFIEGWRVKDYEDYLVTEKKLTQLKGFAAVAEKDEGYLFPDTYDLRVDITTPDLIKLMKDNFDKRTTGLNATPDSVILASIVEREAASDTERADIAGVFANRLKIGMKLESDATIQYAKGNWKTITHDDVVGVESPYNTYYNAGLPPGAICNPGLASIRAALNPTQSGYLFFFHTKGQTYFSTTYADHQAKIRQYFN